METTSFEYEAHEAELDFMYAYMLHAPALEAGRDAHELDELVEEYRTWGLPTARYSRMLKLARRVARREGVRYAAFLEALLGTHD